MWNKYLIIFIISYASHKICEIFIEHSFEVPFDFFQSHVKLFRKCCLIININLFIDMKTHKYMKQWFSMKLKMSSLSNSKLTDWQFSRSAMLAYYGCVQSIVVTTNHTHNIQKTEQKTKALLLLLIFFILYTC